MSENILIVDDEKNVLRMVGYLLEQEGYEISAATTGTQALEKIGAKKPDLIILDILMPDMSGLEVCERIRNNPETVNIPIILFSALSGVSDKVRGLKAGADVYLTKLIEPSEFIAHVESLLQRSQRHDAADKPKGAVWGFIGAKGGVGTTTVVLNLASVLVALGKEVTAVEMRSNFGTFSAQLNLESSKPIAGIAGLLNLSLDKISEQNVVKYLTKHQSGLRILFSPQNVDEFQEIEPRQAEAIIDTVASMTEIVLLDLPCHATRSNQAAIQRCKQVVLVVEAEPTCVASSKVALNLLTSWGIAREIVKLLIVNHSSYVDPIKPYEIEKNLHCGVLGVIPSASDNLIAAQRKGVSMALTYSKSIAAEAFQEIAKKIIAGV